MCSFETCMVAYSCKQKYFEGCQFAKFCRIHLDRTSDTLFEQERHNQYIFIFIYFNIIELQLFRC